MAALVFLTLDDALLIHADQIQRYGGAHSVRAAALLASAMGMPRASFGRAFLHTSLAEMAAAYLFHVARNHPFLDGNKRTGLATALAFLWLNGQRLDADDHDLTAMVMGVAEGQVGKAEAAVFFAARLRPLR